MNPRNREHPETAESPSERPRRRLRRRALIVTAVVVATPLALFCINGLVLATGETPRAGRTGHAAVDPHESRLTIMAYNLAKGFAYVGGGRFESTAVVRQRMRDIAATIKARRPDVVFLSEVLLECTPCAVDQVALLADLTGMHAWAFGENFNVGIPGVRMVSGNAILARVPLRGEANPSLHGRRPFWITRNNRRVLWCTAMIHGTEVLLGSIHTDSFDLDNNLAQTREILAYCDGRPSILAGDFNAGPDTPSIRAIKDSGRFAGEFTPPLTFPAHAPDRTLDYVFAPAGWQLVSHEVLDVGWSDHRPVVATFRVE